VTIRLQKQNELGIFAGFFILKCCVPLLENSSGSVVNKSFVSNLTKLCQLIPGDLELISLNNIGEMLYYLFRIAPKNKKMFALA